MDSSGKGGGSSPSFLQKDGSATPSDVVPQFQHTSNESSTSSLHFLHCHTLHLDTGESIGRTCISTELVNR
jgi:hypothetical protein